MTLNASSAHTSPLLTTDDMLSRVTALLAPAMNPSQLWVAFLDRHRVQTPVLVPIDDCPPLPHPEAAETLAEFAADMIGESLGGTGSVLFVRERLGSDRIEVNDHGWAAVLAGACERTAVEVAGIFLLTPGRVQLLEP